MNLIYMLILVAVFIGIAGLVLPINSDGSIFHIEVNNTNLAPNSPDSTGTGERIQNVTYYANSTPIEIFIFSHGASSGQDAEIHLKINGTIVADVAGKPLGAAEQNNYSIVAIIPRYASYEVEVNNYHHYEWREYRIISGDDGEVIINNNNYTSSSFNGTLLYGLSELNMTDGLDYKYNGGFIIEHSPGNPLGIATNLDMEGNDILNLNAITISGQSGIGTRAACFDASGNLISSTNATYNYSTC